MALYAVALIVFGVYGYVAQVSTQAQNAANLCYSSSTSNNSNVLPECLPSETIAETGSALMYPMFQLWARNFTQIYPNVGINTANTGSGTGQSFVERGIVQIGGSSAFLSDDQQRPYPNILNIALAVTADIIEYNLPELPPSVHLNFTAHLLTEIYNFTVVYWDDVRIKQINVGVASQLPHKPITPIYRSDAAGDTRLFTQYLSDGDAWWNSTGRLPGLTFSWPSCFPPDTPQCPSQPQSDPGNPGIVIHTHDVLYSLSYVSVEALDQWVEKTDTSLGWMPLGTGLLQNKDGNFVDASLANVNASIVARAAQTPPDERLSLINADSPNSYPVIGYGYALVNKQQSNPETALVIRTFLKYCLLPEYGNSLYFLNQYHFAALPQAIIQLSLAQIAKIGP